MTLLYTTQRLLRKAPRHITLRQIADEAELPYAWLRHFAAERIIDPGVRKVQALHDYLLEMPSTRPTRWSWSQACSRILPEDPGVYRIYDADGFLIYVGKTNSVSRRMSEHARCQEILDLNPAYVTFIEISDEGQREWLETLCIRVYNPQLNVLKQRKGGYRAGIGKSRSSAKR